MARNKMGFVVKLILLLFCSVTVSSYAITTELHDSNGRLLNLDEFKNKWIIVNYWADWCESCMEEIPELNRFHQNNQGKDIVFFGVNYDRLPKLYLNQAMDKMGITFPVLLEDPNSLWHLGEVTVLPTTFIINPQGDVVKKIIGPNTEQSLLKLVNNRVLAKSKSNKKYI